MVRDLRSSVGNASAWMAGALACCAAGYVMGHGYESFHHREITFARALEILKTERDNELRNAARGVLHDAVGAAIRALREESDAGDLRAATVLAHWRAFFDK